MQMAMALAARPAAAGGQETAMITPPWMPSFRPCPAATNQDNMSHHFLQLVLLIFLAYLAYKLLFWVYQKFCILRQLSPEGVLSNKFSTQSAASVFYLAILKSAQVDRDILCKTCISMDAKAALL